MYPIHVNDREGLGPKVLCDGEKHSECIPVTVVDVVGRALDPALNLQPVPTIIQQAFIGN
uniref:Uncharacterized protein n=1 Tax=Acrobeloides nanus TaxID=290746 RepID=A0A914DNW5_9BILA